MECVSNPRILPPKPSAFFTNGKRTQGPNHSPKSQWSQNPVTVEPFKFPPTTHILWDRRPQGDHELLHLYSRRNMRVMVNEQTLRLAVRHLNQSASPFNSFLIGSLSVDSREEGLALHIDRFDPGREIAERDGSAKGAKYKVPTTIVPGDQVIPIRFIKGLIGAENSVTHSKEEFDRALMVLHSRITGEDALTLTNFISFKACCHAHSGDDEVILNLHFGAVTMETGILAIPVTPVPIIPTALARNLAGPLRLSEVHGVPKCGFLTMDNTRKLLLLLESDPKAFSLPLIGVWVSGSFTVHHPFVWACCIKFLNCKSIKERVVAAPNTFLLVHYSPANAAPIFWECAPQEQSSTGPFELYSCYENLHFEVPFSDKFSEPLRFDLLPCGDNTNRNLFDQAVISWNNKRQSSNCETQQPVTHETSNSYLQDGSLIPRPSPSPHPQARQNPLFVPEVPEVSLSLSFEDTNTRKLQENANVKELEIPVVCFPELKKQTRQSRNSFPNKENVFSEPRNFGKQVISNARNSPNREPLKQITRDNQSQNTPVLPSKRGKNINPHSRGTGRPARGRGRVSDRSSATPVSHRPMTQGNPQSTQSNGTEQGEAPVNCCQDYQFEDNYAAAPYKPCASSPTQSKASDDPSLPNKRASDDLSLPNKRASDDLSLPNKRASDDLSLPNKRASDDHPSLQNNADPARCDSQIQRGEKLQDFHSQPTPVTKGSRNTETKLSPSRFQDSGVGDSTIDWTRNDGSPGSLAVMSGVLPGSDAVMSGGLPGSDAVIGGLPGSGVVMSGGLPGSDAVIGGLPGSDAVIGGLPGSGAVTSIHSEASLQYLDPYTMLKQQEQLKEQIKELQEQIKLLQFQQQNLSTASLPTETSPLPASCPSTVPAVTRVTMCTNTGASLMLSSPIRVNGKKSAATSPIKAAESGTDHMKLNSNNTSTASPTYPDQSGESLVLNAEDARQAMISEDPNTTLASSVHAVDFHSYIGSPEATERRMDKNSFLSPVLGESASLIMDDDRTGDESGGPKLQQQAIQDSHFEDLLQKNEKLFYDNLLANAREFLCKQVEGENKSSHKSKTDKSSSREQVVSSVLESKKQEKFEEQEPREQTRVHEPTTEEVIQATMKELEKIRCGNSSKEHRTQTNGRDETFSRSASMNAIPNHPCINYVSLALDETMDEVSTVDAIALKYLTSEQLQDLHQASHKQGKTVAGHHGYGSQHNLFRSSPVDFTITNLSMATQHYLEKYNLVARKLSEERREQSHAIDSGSKPAHRKCSVDSTSKTSQLLQCLTPPPSPDPQHFKSAPPKVLDIDRLRKLPKLF
ncbi:predicted protein [Nematostella vectensis]|uniref:STIL N-terminal domain-containing protein n=1 Tax=Nematostella vectensis TaxID=45351 RepID=A7SQL9_NEMVE|nr:predicted protein [Nematostella vectensis]|eukprot:XP_001626088.1 predicted protein [Nematostella vectensis]